MALEDELLRQRHERLAQIRALGFDPYGQAFEFSHTIPQILEKYGSKTAEELAEKVEVKVAGRILTVRRMGKAGFLHLLENGEKLQIYVRKDAVSETAYQLYELLDIGDIIGVTGYLFRTKTDELSIHVDDLTFLSKIMLALPEKWHGLEDVETRYRQRYLDLIANSEVRKVFITRAKIVSSLRRQLDARGFLEVETPMMQPLYGGAAARPFKTHHNALDIDLYLRIAPELYLKRLVVGGLERVYEINRNFRNEGISVRHNPEFTMLEVYQAYGDYETMMDLAQGMVVSIAESIADSLLIKRHDGQEIDLTPPWRRVTYHELIEERIGKEWFTLTPEERKAQAITMGVDFPANAPDYEVTNAIFEKMIEPTLMNPTFVTHLPAELVVLAKPNKENPSLVDVFELVINGQEIAPAYSELNDPVLQRVRLLMQAKGHDEKLDEDFLLALEHGMPPAGGMGMGIDRLVMMLTGVESIRDVILFPLLRPQT